MRTTSHKTALYTNTLLITILFLIKADVHLVQMSLLLTKERPAWRPRIPNKML
jgi:hypothetical protein